MRNCLCVVCVCIIMTHFGSCLSPDLGAKNPRTWLLLDIFGSRVTRTWIWYNWTILWGNFRKEHANSIMRLILTYTHPQNLDEKFFLRSVKGSFPFLFKNYTIQYKQQVPMKITFNMYLCVHPCIPLAASYLAVEVYGLQSGFSNSGNMASPKKDPLWRWDGKNT